MIPVQTFYKSIGDISVYCEVFAKGDRTKNTDKDGAFLNGRNDVIVLLHGNGEDGRIFSDVVSDLAENNYVLTIDSRGHGKTDSGNEDFTIDLFAEDLSKICDGLNLKTIKLFGFSDGGNVALTFSFRHPKRVSALCVCGANLNPSGLCFTFRLKVILKCFFSALLKNKSKQHNLKYQLLSLMANYPHISPRMLKNIECDTLVVAASKDLIMSKHTDLIAKSIPKSKKVIVSSSSHNVFSDNPIEIQKILYDFFN